MGAVENVERMSSNPQCFSGTCGGRQASADSGAGPLSSTSVGTER